MIEAARVISIVCPISGWRIKPNAKREYNISDIIFDGTVLTIDSDRNHEIKTIKVGLANSEGCTEIMPKSNHLVAPFIGVPNIFKKNTTGFLCTSIFCRWVNNYVLSFYFIRIEKYYHIFE